MSRPVGLSSASLARAQAMYCKGLSCARIGAFFGVHGDWIRTLLRRRGVQMRRRGAYRRPIKHGTHSGYVVHRQRGEPACDPCKRAHAVWSSDQRRWSA